MRDYEGLQYACDQLRLMSKFHDVGLLNQLISRTGNTLVDESFLCCYWYEILESLADFVRIGGNDDFLTARLYFSDSTIRTYFDFAQNHAKAQGEPLQKDPYYRNAYDYFCETMLDHCPYSCYFRLVTQTHHPFGYGLSVWYDEEQFEGHENLVSGLLKVMDFFRCSVQMLRDSGQLADNTIAPFPAAVKNEVA